MYEKDPDWAESMAQEFGTTYKSSDEPVQSEPPKPVDEEELYKKFKTRRDKEEADELLAIEFAFLNVLHPQLAARERLKLKYSRQHSMRS